jgi:ribosomal protein S18 acetylase RimI-like enzyme
MGTDFRAARSDDVPLVAQVLCMAGRGHLERGPWDFVFPDDAVRQRALERIAGGAERSFCHRSVFQVAELDGQAAAALCAFEPGELGDSEGLNRAMGFAFAELGTPPDHIARVAPMLGAYLRCFPDMPAGTWIVENVGTLPEARRKGLVAALLGRALEAGRRRGHRRAQISVLIGNDPARRAYENIGFRVVESLESPEFAALMGVPGFSRMALEL